MAENLRVWSPRRSTGSLDFGVDENWFTGYLTGFAMTATRHLYPLVQPVLKRIRRSRWLIGRLFNVRIPPGVQVQFDPTTIMLSREVRRLARMRPARTTWRVLEMGIGEGALISLSLALDSPEMGTDQSSLDVEVHGVDCSAPRLESSMAVARHNQLTVLGCPDDSDPPAVVEKAAVWFWQSDLFAFMPGELKFDLITFNPPYVPTQTGRDLRLTQRLQIDGDQMWDGGDDGTAVLRSFLIELKPHLHRDGHVLFGVQPIFVDDDRIRDVLEETGYDLVEMVDAGSLPCNGYRVRCKSA